MPRNHTTRALALAVLVPALAVPIAFGRAEGEPVIPRVHVSTTTAGLGGVGTMTGDPGKPDAARRSVALRFGARVGDEVFACGGSYPGLNGTDLVLQPRDLRLYVSEVELLRSDGTAETVELEQDGLWQYRNVALIDFEDGTGECRNGTPNTRSEVLGSVTEGEYSGVRFTLGVPFELNHMNQAVAPSPLSLTAMFWSWNAGYKFLRAELFSEEVPQGFLVHLGSTLCAPEGSASRPATSCANPNRLVVEFPEFDPATDEIVFDLASLLAGSELGGEGWRCNAGPTDPNCASVLEALGLPHEMVEGGGEQRVFRVERSR